MLHPNLPDGIRYCLWFDYSSDHTFLANFSWACSNPFLSYESGSKVFGGAASLLRTMPHEAFSLPSVLVVPYQRRSRGPFFRSFKQDLSFVAVFPL